MSLQRISISLVLGFSLLTANARAHFVWVHIKPERQELQLQFGEPGSPDFSTLHYLENVRAWTIAGAPLELEFTPTSVTASLSGAEFIGAAEMTFGLYGPEDAKFLLEYHAKGKATLTGSTTTIGLGVELLAERRAESIVLTVLVGGSPHAGAEVIVMVPGSDDEFEFETDEQGQVTFDPESTDAFHVRALVIEDRSGEHAGSAYGSVKHYSTLTITSIGEGDSHPLTRPSTAVSIIGLMPRAVTSFGATEHNGYAYTLGGYFGRPHAYRREFQSTAFRRMRLSDGTWEELPSVGPLQSPALVAHGDSIYRVGGMIAVDVGDGEQELESLADFARFDPIAREWQALPDLPKGRSSHMAAVLGDQLYVVGGWAMFADSDRDPEWHDDLLRFDLSDANAEWESLPVPFRRRALGIAVAGDRLYVIGGMQQRGGISKSVDIFDPATGEWRHGPEFPTGAFALAAVGLGSRIYASASDGEVFTLARGDASWTPVAKWNFPRMFHQLIEGEDGELLALGGITKGGRVRQVESIALTGPAPTTRITHWQLPAPGVARRGQASALSGNSIKVSGGRLGRSTEELNESFRLDLADLSWRTLEQAQAAAPSLALASSTEGVVIGQTLVRLGKHGALEALDAATQARSSVTDALPQVTSAAALFALRDRLLIYCPSNNEPVVDLWLIDIQH